MRSTDRMSRRKRLNSSFVSKTTRLRMPWKRKEKMERNGPETQKILWSWLRPSMGSEEREELWRS
eukprot:164501-Karenia_brevis.AAC.1